MEDGGSLSGRKRLHDKMWTDRNAETSPHQAASPVDDQDGSTPRPGESGHIHSSPPTVPTSTEVPSGQAPRSANESGQEDAEVNDDIEATEPNVKIEDFDWNGLEASYHTMMEQRREVEAQLVNDFSSLMDYFSVWAQTTATHEVDRSFKRLRTRMYHVQYSEELLEQKRQHYLKVVQAFESALSLLNGP